MAQTGYGLGEFEQWGLQGSRERLTDPKRGGIFYRQPRCPKPLRGGKPLDRWLCVPAFRRVCLFQSTAKLDVGQRYGKNLVHTFCALTAHEHVRSSNVWIIKLFNIMNLLNMFNVNSYHRVASLVPGRLAANKAKLNRSFALIRLSRVGKRLTRSGRRPACVPSSAHG